MSVSASIDLRVVQSSTGKLITPIKAIELLAHYGWSLQRDGYVCYLPPGDGDNFGWDGRRMSIESLMAILTKKEDLSELIGVLLTWKNTDIGGNLLLYGNKKSLEKDFFTPISFHIDGNRKQLVINDSYGMTDVNWYLEKLLPAFNQGDTYVEYFSYDEHI